MTWPAGIGARPPDAGAAGVPLKRTEVDRRGAETAALRLAVDFAAKRVLEIGAGDGRLTFRVASAPRLLAAIELDLGQVVRTRGVRSRGRAGRPSFLPADAVQLPFRGDTFDVAVLAWSL